MGPVVNLLSSISVPYPDFSPGLGILKNPICLKFICELSQTDNELVVVHWYVWRFQILKLGPRKSVH